MVPPVNRLVFLMYHALYANDGELARIDLADRPYAISVDTFEGHLQCLQDTGISILDPRALLERRPARGGVVLTFDDGHLSNWAHAYPRLQQRGLAAAFFVTRDFINGRAGFCRWPQLREMADSGMLIGSHGCSHRFFDDMDERQAIVELRTSREAIEQHVGKPVDQMSFPGGRYRPLDIELGITAGYRLFHSSQVGALSPLALHVGQVLPRIAIRARTTQREFGAYASAQPLTLWRAQAAAACKGAARRALGNRFYQSLYEKRSR